MGEDNSHSLSSLPLVSPRGDLNNHAPSLQDLSTVLSESPHLFLQPTAALHGAALQLAKQYLDPLAASVSTAQRQRQQQARLKRKRGDYAAEEDLNGHVLKLNQLHLDGFDINQVWGQTQMVLDAARGELARNEASVRKKGDRRKFSLNGDGVLAKRRKSGGPDEAGSANTTQLNGHEKTVSFADLDYLSESEEDEFISGDSEDEEALSGNEVLGETAEDEELSEDAEEADSPNQDMEEVDDLRISEDEGTDQEERSDTMVKDKFGLNDGFFSIDDFNKQAMVFERQDTTADGVDLDDDEDDEIDWDADPANIVAARIQQPKDKSGRGPDHIEEDDESDDDEDGPTFGDVDHESEEDDDGDMQDADAGLSRMNGMADTNDVRYDEFFRPPARAAKAGGRSSKRSKSARKSMDVAQGPGNEDNVQRTIAAVRRDLFDDDISTDEDDNPGTIQRSLDKDRQSTYERRQAKLAEEIRRLEAANVAKKEWTLSGEARAADRPVNSLLEEDLEFERTGKPVPVITAEVSESIEEMIKRRIVNQEFDELIRRRPDELLAPAEVRRGRFELDDNKAQRSLAQIYEEEHMRQVDPEGHPDRRSDKLKKEHAEIEALWADICGNLDALSNWHYRPKPPKPALNIVADVPTIAMEDARPTATVGGDGHLTRSSMLAPQEIYTPGKDKAGLKAPRAEGAAQGKEVVLKSGIPISTEEMTREEKVRRRRREKERLKKKLAGEGPATGPEAGAGDARSGGKNQKRSVKQREKDAIVNQLNKGGVKIIGRRGEVVDTKGRVISGRDGGRGPAAGGDMNGGRGRSAGLLKL